MEGNNGDGNGINGIPIPPHPVPFVPLLPIFPTGEIFSPTGKVLCTCFAPALRAFDNKINIKKPQMKKTDIIIGIDPDIDQSGVATITTATGIVTAQRMRFPDLLDHLASEHGKAAMGGLTLAVHVEAGWLNTSNWHTNRRMGANYNAAIGQAVGRNQAVGMKLLEMCRHMGMDAFAVRPLQKTMRVGSVTQQMWGGTDGKVRADELEQLLADNGLYMPKGRTNQDERDAVLIALRAAGYAIYPRKVFARQAHIN